MKQALQALKDSGATVTPDAEVTGYWFQSVGGHGQIALPETLMVALEPHPADGEPAVTLENVPPPKELTKATGS